MYLLKKKSEKKDLRVRIHPKKKKKKNKKEKEHTQIFFFAEGETCSPSRHVVMTTHIKKIRITQKNKKEFFFTFEKRGRK